MSSKISPSRVSQKKKKLLYASTNHVSSTDWPQEETEQAASGTTANGSTVHLWEESWDDDNDAEDFAKQLQYVMETCCWMNANEYITNREEVKKVEAAAH